MLIRNCGSPSLEKLLFILFLLSIAPGSLFATNLRLRLPVAASGNRVDPSVSSPSQQPRLLTQNNSTRAVALEAVTLRSEPFRISQPINFGTDSRTRLLLFATDIDPTTAETLSAFSADAEDGNHNVYPLQVEYISRVSISEITYAIHVRLNDQMSEAGDVLVRLYFNGLASNRVRVGLGTVGGGLPDDGGPEILAVSPSSVIAGASDSTLSVMGSNFTSGSKLFLNGIEHSATVASANLMSSPLTASDVALAGNYPVRVESSAGVSNSVSFAVNSPQPAIVNISPASVIKGGSGFTLSVNGSGFVQGSAVNFNGNNRLATFVSSALLTVQILAADVSVAGSFPVKVANPTPGGGNSNSLLLSVTVPGPSPSPTPSPSPSPSPSPTPSPSPSPSPSPTPSLSPTSYDLAIRQRNPWGYWRLSETSGTTFADSSGNSRTLTIVGSVTKNSASLLLDDANPAANFSGGNGRRSSSFSNTTGLSFVTLLVADSSTTMAPMGIGSIGSLMFSGGTSWTWRWKNSGGTQSESYFSFTPVSGRPYLIGITHDYTAREVKFYVNGALQGTATHPSVAAGAYINETIYVGRQELGYPWDGIIDEPALFTSVLTAADFKALMRSSRAIPSATTGFYVSTTGVYHAKGSLANPLDLQSALDAKGILSPGDANTLVLLPGTYSLNDFRFNISGTVDNPIVVKPLNQVWPPDVKLELAPDAPIHTGCGFYGNYVWLRDVDIYFNTTQRVSAQPGSSPSDIPIGTRSGAGDGGTGNKFINVLAHDMYSGLNSSYTSSGNEIYGSFSYNNGWDAPDRTHGHGMYIQHKQTGANAINVKENIIFNNYSGWGVHVYNSQQGSTAGGFHFYGNILIDDKFEIIGGANKEDVIAVGNHSYGQGMRFGDSDEINFDATITDNISYGTGPMNILYWTNLTVARNKFVQKATTSDVFFFRKPSTSTPISNYSFSGNEYWRGLTGWPIGAVPNFGILNQTGGYNWLFSSWQALGLDTGGTYHVGTNNTQAVRPTGTWIDVRPNVYQLGRGHIVVWNWNLLNTVQADLSSLGLVTGQTYKIYDGQNPKVVWATGTYNASGPNATINLPNGSSPVAQPIGDPNKWTHTNKEFNTFLVIPGPRP